MIDKAFWQIRVCDLCFQDQSALEPRLKGIMENGYWVDGFSLEKAIKAREIRAVWYEEISCPCLVLKADMEEVVICEKHLAEAVAKKSELDSITPSV
jgi:hypothetical protein